MDLTDLLRSEPDEEWTASELRAWAAARRAHKAGATVIEIFDYEEIYERDEYVCWICGEAILIHDPAKANNAKSGRSIDHVIPLSKGGHHTRENCRAAHRGCNSKKSDQMPTTADLARLMGTTIEPDPPELLAG